MRSLKRDLDEAASTIKSLNDDVEFERASSDSWHEAYEEAEHRAQMTDKLWQQSTIFINEVIISLEYSRPGQYETERTCNLRTFRSKHTVLSVSKISSKLNLCLN